MAIIEQHRSPDGLLELLVDNTAGDWTIGFKGYAYHTHGDILAATEYPGTVESAVRAFVDDILSSRRVIVVSRINGRVRDFAIPENTNPDHDYMKYALPGETIEKRFWNGRKVAD